jgi:hypothetical protein
MSMEELINLWPRDWASFPDQNKARSNGQNLVVRRVFTNNGVGLAFEGDDTPNGDYTGAIWNIKGQFNEEIGKFDDYAGAVPAEGSTVNATLAISYAVDKQGQPVLSKKTGLQMVYRDCKINHISGAQTETRFTPEGEEVQVPIGPAVTAGSLPDVLQAAAIKATQAQDWGPLALYPTDIRIAAQAFANRMANLLAADVDLSAIPDSDLWLQAFAEIQTASIPKPMRDRLSPPPEPKVVEVTEEADEDLPW